MNAIAELRTLFKGAPVWFWFVIAVGAVIRIYLVVFTQGTQDVEIWERHARDVVAHGVVGHYHVDPTANHPPFISEIEALLVRAADATGVPFRIWLRAPFALIDAASALLLLILLGQSASRFLLVAIYWINPLSMILSAYHGNTDSAIAFFLLLAVVSLSNNRIVAAAAAIGVSLWIKLPIIVAIPALTFAIPKWRQRFVFLGLIMVVGLSTHVPALVQDAPIVWQNVFGYRAQNLHTTAGVPTWGPRVILFSIIASPEKWPTLTHAPILWFLEHSWLIAFALAIAMAWLRRHCRSCTDLGATIGISYVIIYAFSDGWSFQYFAWSLPFWFLLPVWFAAPAVLLTSVYIYALYAYLCGNPWLLGRWDFIGHPDWPIVINWFRNLAVLVFVVGAVFFLATTITSRARVFRR
ncbi:MAG: hypothetical protein QOG48_566 [Verrucomicrobiota bacterium]|jgi:hypothetical protein